MKPLYIKLTDIPKTNTRKEFLRRFTQGKAYRSYYDEDCTEIQCKSGAYRSITELHRLTLSRFPKTSLEAIVRIIRDLIDENGCIRMVYCNDVCKVVVRLYDKATNQYISDFSREKFYETKGVDGYSLSDYEKIIKNLLN